MSLLKWKPSVVTEDYRGPSHIFFAYIIIFPQRLTQDQDRVNVGSPRANIGEYRAFSSALGRRPADKRKPLNP